MYQSDTLIVENCLSSVKTYHGQFLILFIYIIHIYDRIIKFIEKFLSVSCRQKKYGL